MKSIWLVIPCYNEEEIISKTAEHTKELMYALISAGKISKASRILFVNDGSTDRTYEIIKELCRKDKIFACVNLSRNRGHQNALLAGLMTAKNYADATISMDADLQDDINVIKD